MQATEHPWRNIFCAVLFFCAVLALYLPYISSNYIWDDGELIGNNSFTASCTNITTALNPVNLLKVLPVPMSARPLVNASIIADTCSGNGPAGMKFTNVLLHAFNATALFFLLLALTGFEEGAFIGALLFVVHPAAAETLHIITFRSHLLGFFFFSLSLSFAIFYSRKPAALSSSAAALCYLLALLSVETSIVLPAAALLAIYFDSGRQGLRKAAPLFAVLAAIALFYLWFWTPRSGYEIQGITTPGIRGPSLLYPSGLFPLVAPQPQAGVATLTPWRDIYISPLANLLTMARITLEYLGILLTTWGLNTDYNPKVIKSFWLGIGPLAAAISVLGASIWLFLKKNIVGLGLLLTFTALLPALNIAPIYNIKAARYLYLPLAGFALVTSGLLQTALNRKGLKLAGLLLSGLWVCGLAAETLRRNVDFRSDLSFFSAAIKRNPAIPRAQVNLARALLLSGDCAGAIMHSRQAIELDKGNPKLRLRLVASLNYCGRAEALEEAEATLKLFPGNTYAADMLKLIRGGSFGDIRQ